MTTAPSLSPRARRADELARPLVEQGVVKGLAIAVVTADGAELLMYGERSSGGGAPTADTAFEVASVSKVFTALVLADMVTRKEIDLDEKLGLGTTITLEQLATHSSGLPRLPTDLPVELGDPYGPYTAAQLEHFLAGSRDVARPAGSYDYSNLGFGALGHALEVATRTPFAALVEARVATPLGLARTRVGDVGGDVATGHDAGGAPAPSWQPGALSGAYAVRSTARDLAALVAANLAPDTTPLAAAIRLTHAPRLAIPTGHIGLAWHIADRGDGVLWHNGRSAGFSCFVAFHPGRQRGFVVLANTSTEQLDALGARLVRAIILRD